MSESGRRQDVAFLTLAVAVLAIAVALFVVMRAIPKQGSGAPTEETQEEKAEKPGEAPKEEPADGRDPFRSQAGAAGVAAAGPTQAELTLVGITRAEGREPMAAIRRGRRRYYVKAGDAIGGDRVVSIGESEVVLEGESGQLTLVLRRPEEEE